VTVPEKRKLLNTASLEILRPSGQSVLGLILSWVAVALMIGGFYAITR